MLYLKKPYDREAEDSAYKNLANMEDARIPGSDTRLGHARVLPVPQCDWCGSDEPLVVYAATHLTSGEQQQCWRWMACERCDQMITRDNWDWLKRKMAAAFKRTFAARMQAENPRPVPDSLIDEAITRSLDDFFRYAIPVMEPGGGKSTTVPRN